jgi:hypothetical protein
MKDFILIVEGKTDQQIVEPILNALGINNIEVKAAKGQKHAIDQVQNKYVKLYKKVGLLIDSDTINLIDAKEQVRGYSSDKIEVFLAIPSIEAWLFADDQLAIKNANSELATKTLERLPLPDEIPYPKQTAYNIFRDLNTFSFLKEINIYRAASRSPSLNDFIKRICIIAGVMNPIELEPITKSLDRRIFINLLNEINSSDTIVFKSNSGAAFTAKDMISEIKNETSIGINFTNDLLRIARDLLIRKSRVSQ